MARGLEWIWIDTCCIDKRSRAELSEAINSMFKWYQRSEECYVFLPDVYDGEGHRTWYQLDRSVWFTRGWTLQELLAPLRVEFFDARFRSIGSRWDIRKSIEEITGIDEDFLKFPDHLPRASVAERMKWASHRQTTRAEDAAYSLLGIFDVNMPLLYGEGKKAFKRLQAEIIRKSADESIFA